MKKGKLLALVLSIVLVFGSFSSAFADTAKVSQYSDMPDNWSKAALSRAVDNGLLKGYEDGIKALIKANNPLTRAEMAAVVNRAFGATVAGDIKTVTDVPASAWYAKDMAKAVKMNTFAFDTKMRPNDLITRQEAFAVLARAFKLTNTDIKNKALDKFADKGDIASWALKDLNGMAEAGYIKGSPDGKLYPNANITRAEFAVVMDSLVKQYIDQAGIVTDVTGNGNVMIRTGGVTLKGVTVKGDLIIGDGVGEGDAVLEDVKVEGRTLVRGGGVNSIIIKGNSDLGKVFVCKTFGEVRVATEGDAQIEVIYVDDGSDDVIVNGTIGTLEVVGDNVTVTATGATITQGIVKGEQSSIIVNKGSTVNTITVSGPNAVISGEGEVKAVTVVEGGHNAAITTPATKIDVDKNANGVTGGGGINIPAGAIENNNQNGTGILSPTTGSGGGGGKTETVNAINITTDPVNVSGLENDAEVTVTLSTKTDGASIYYTLDGTVPTKDSTLFEEAFTVKTENSDGENITIKAIGIKTGMSNSADVQKTIVFKAVKVVVEPEIIEVGYIAAAEITDIDPDTVTFAEGKFTVPANVTEFAFKDGDKEMKATFKDEKWAISEVPVTVTVETTGANNGFKVKLSAEIAISKDNLSLKLGDIEKAINSIDIGESYYWVDTEILQRGTTYTLTITKEGYNFGDPVSVTIPTVGTVTGAVTNLNNVPLEGVVVNIGFPIMKTVTTGADGKYIANDIIEGTHTVSFIKEGYKYKAVENVKVTGTVTVDAQLDLTDTAKVAIAKENLTLGDVTAVTADLTLPSTQDDATITWVSSNTEVIANDGKVTRPAFGEEDTSVTLTATIDVGGARGTKDFTVVVKALGDAEQAVFDAEQTMAEFENGVYTREEYNIAINLRNSANTKVSALEDGDKKTALESKMAKVSEDLGKYDVLLDEYGALAALPEYNFSNPMLQNLQQIVKRYTFVGSGRNLAVTYTWITTDPDIAYIYESDEPDHTNCELVIFRPENGKNDATTTLNLTMTYLGKILKNSFIITIAEFTEEEQGYITTLEEKADILIFTFQIVFPDNMYNESGMDQDGALDTAIKNYNSAYYAAQEKLGFIGNLDKIDETYHNIYRLVGAIESIIELLENQIPTGKLYEDFHLPTTEMVDYSGITVNWVSSNLGVMDSEGIVTRPAIGHQDAEVTLTLTLNSTLTSLTLKDTFNFTVLAITPLEEITIAGVTAIDMPGAENNGKVQVSWTPLTGEQITQTGASGYTIFYWVEASSSGFGWVDIKGANESSYVIEGLEAGKEYEIYVFAYNDNFRTKDGEPVLVTPTNQ
ncbi:MAG: S-layer homology domain-containing protein [Eubacteriales bacterium]|nr:S-layer homology domain-containing protein [Eubacteriales bacterium]